MRQLLKKSIFVVRESEAGTTEEVFAKSFPHLPAPPRVFHYTEAGSLRVDDAEEFAVLLDQLITAATLRQDEEVLAPQAALA